MKARPALARALSPIAAIALAAGLALPGLGSPGLLDPWEMERVAAARAMAGPRRVVVVGPELTAEGLAAELGEGFVVRRLEGGLPRALTELSTRLVHGLVIDAKVGLAFGDRQALIEARVGELDRVVADHPFAKIWVSTDAPAAEVREAVGRGRARGAVRSLQAGFWRHGFPDSARADELAPLFWGDLEVVAPAELAAAVAAGTPSPWAMPLHVVDGKVVPVPLLDTWLVAASLAAFGPTEAAARLPSALLLLLAVGWLFVALRRRYDATTAWLSTFVLATLPMAVGMARAVTLEASASLGLLAVALATLSLHERDAASEQDPAAPAPSSSALAWAALALGLLILLGGRGLGGLTMGAAVVVGAAFVAGRGLRAWSAALAAAAALVIAALWVLGDDASAVTRSLRFTRAALSGGLPATSRDLSTVIGQVGFGLHPWGGLLLLGAGRLAFAGRDEGRGPQIWLLALGAGLLVTMALLPNFSHVIPPVAPIAAAIIALFLRDALAGRVAGPISALVLVIAAALLHRETGKDAGTLVRTLAWDPPFGGENAAFQWPEELKAPRAARAIAFLGVAAFALTLAQPVATLRRWVRATQAPRPAAWLIGVGLVGWALDLLVSLGIRLDAALRIEAERTGYDYDRLWTTIVTTRPEVVAGGVAFVGAVALASAASAPAMSPARALLLPWRALGRPLLASIGLIAAGLGALVAGLMVHVAVAQQGWGAALADGASQPIALVALALTFAAAGLRAGAKRLGGFGAFIPGTRGLVALGAVIVGAVGVGASAAVGTWSYGLLAACWGAAIAGLAAAVGAPQPLASLVRTLIVTATLTAVPLAWVLGLRFVEVVTEGPAQLIRIALLSPDALALLSLAVLAALNRLALRAPRLESARYLAIWWLGLVELPVFGVATATLAGLALASGVAFGLLPEMSVHFSQKHLLAAIADAGGDVGADPPVAFKHPGAAGGRVLGSNFYTASLPTLSQRDEALTALTAPGVVVDAPVHVSDWGESARLATVALAKDRRFLVVPKSEFSTLNAAHRERFEGRSVRVLDASSSRLVLATNELPPGRANANWIDEAILTPAQFAEERGVQKISADFDGALELVGWRLAEASVRRGQKYQLDLYFHVKRAVPLSYMLFMHPHPLHRDLWPLAVVPHSEAEGKRCTGCFQTNHWRVGDVVRVDVDQEVPLGTSAGPAEIILGLFDPQSDKRLPLLTATGPNVVKHGDNRVTIGSLVVR